MGQKGIIGIFVLILILAIAVAGGAYYFGKVSNRSQVAETNQATPVTPLPSKASATEGDPTANWKTHTNQKLGFSMAYPNDWTVTENPITGGTLPGTQIAFQSPADLEHNSNPLADFGNGLFLYVYEKSSNMTIDDFLKKDRGLSDPTFLQWQTFTVGSTEARSYTNLPRCCNGEDIFLDTGSHIFYFVDMTMTNPARFRAILSTFKFTSQ